MSFITRLIQRLKPSRFVGRDLEGNRFYEHPNLNDSSRTKRTIQYKNSADMWQYIGGAKRLPVQWSSWLRHTRPHPPTLDELQTDMVRQQRVLANVALIEARDREESVELLRLQAKTPVSDRPAKETAAPQDLLQPSPEGSREHVQESSPTPESPLPKMATRADLYEPEPWTPRATRTRGG